MLCTRGTVRAGSNDDLKLWPSHVAALESCLARHHHPTHGNGLDVSITEYIP